jgi:hypothetical protein
VVASSGRDQYVSGHATVLTRETQRRVWG